MKSTITYRQELKYFLLVSAFSPAFGLWRLFQSKNDRFIIIGSMLIMGFFGALFSYPEGTDGYSHYLNSVQYYSFMTFSEFWLESWNILIQSPSYGTTDLYIHLLSFISNSILSIPKSLHFFAGLILGYFIAKSLLLVLGSNLKNLTWQSGLSIFIILLFVHSVYSLNAIRIATGAWVLFFGSASFYFTKNLKYLLLLLLAIQIHLAYSIIAIPVILAFFFANKKRLIIGVWAMSFFFQLSFIDVSSYLPETEVVESKRHDYVFDDNYIQVIELARESRQANWYTIVGPNLYFNVALNIAIAGMLFVFIRIGDSKFNFMFSASLLLYAVANIVSFIPSLQGRLTNNVSIFLLFALLYLLQNLSYFKVKKTKYHFFKLAVFIFSLLSVPLLIKSLSHILSTTEVFFLAAPIVSIFLDGDFSIRDILGDIL